MSDYVFDGESLTETARALRSGERSLASYAEERVERVAAVEGDVEALVGEFDESRYLSDSIAVADRYDDPWERPPLYGVPVGVKDIYHVDGFPTRAGSELVPTELTGSEATSVTALKEAGAVVLDKTVTTEFAYFAPGPTRNPHDLGHTPGGSSSGSAAAVAAGECPLALGTQTVGSVIRPASFCGVVGFKPSVGRIPTEGIIPFSTTVDHVGTFAQDVAGTELAASVLCENWDSQAAANATEDPVLGIPEGPYLQKASQDGLAAFESQVETLADAGYEIRRFDAFADIEERYERHNELIAAEMALTHHDRYEAYGDQLADTTAELIREGRAVSVGNVGDGRRSHREFQAEIDETMTEAGVDALICPAAPGPAPEGIDSTGDPAMNLPWTHAGVPATTVPAGTVDGLPVGLQCVTRFGNDESLLAWADDIAAAL